MENNRSELDKSLLDPTSGIEIHRDRRQLWDSSGQHRAWLALTAESGIELKYYKYSR